MKRRFAALAALCALVAGQEQAARYYLVILRPDPARKELTKEESDRLRTVHLANVKKMSDDGVLIAAGPFEDTPPTLTGIFVFHVASIEAAEELANADPMVSWHRNTAEAHVWMGPPGIGEEYRRLHKQNPGMQDEMKVRPLCLLYHGPAWEEKRASRGEVMTRHAAYISSLRDRGKLGAAGWVEGNGDLAGMVIFKTIPNEEAEALLKDDPAVREGLLRVEPHHWWSAEHVLPW